MPVAIYLQKGRSPNVWYEQIFEDGGRSDALVGENAKYITMKYTHTASVVSSAKDPHISVMPRKNIATFSKVTNARYEIGSCERFENVRHGLAENSIVIIR